MRRPLVHYGIFFIQKTPPKKISWRCFYFLYKNKEFLLRGNFAYGEYSRALRLTSELVDLRVANANPIRAFPFEKKNVFRFCAKMGSRAERVSKMKRTPTRSAYQANGNFAYGEYSRALHLVSKLPDFRAANANPYLLRLRLAEWVLFGP